MNHNVAMWGNPTLFHRAKSIEKHIQERKILVKVIEKKIERRQILAKAIEKKYIYIDRIN